MDFNSSIKTITSADYGIYIYIFLRSCLVLTFHLLYRAIAAISFSAGFQRVENSRLFATPLYDSTAVSSAIFEAGSVRKLLKKKAKTRGAKTKLVSES